MPDELWYYDACGWTTSFLAGLALLVEGWTVLRTLNLVRDNMQAGVSEAAVVPGFVMVATGVCTIMATVAGWCW
jgi:hypothetical protein